MRFSDEQDIRTVILRDAEEARQEHAKMLRRHRRVRNVTTLLWMANLALFILTNYAYIDFLNCVLIAIVEGITFSIWVYCTRRSRRAIQAYARRAANEIYLKYIRLHSDDEG